MTKRKILIFISLIGITLLVFLTVFLRIKSVPPGSEFKLIAVSPSLSPNELYSAGLQITLTFNQPVSPKQFHYSLTPPIGIAPRLASEGRQVIFSPEGPWPEGNFLLKISKETKSSRGVNLTQDYQYRFQVAIPPSDGAD